jgi:hypothetical protein
VPPDLPRPPQPGQPGRPPPPVPPAPPVTLPRPDQLSITVGGRARTTDAPAGGKAEGKAEGRTDPFARRPSPEVRTPDTTRATPAGPGGTDRFARKEPVDTTQASASRILDLNRGANPVVKLDGPTRAQFEAIARGPQAPDQTRVDVMSKGRGVPIGPEQAEALSVLRGLADTTAARREQTGDTHDQLEIV